MSVKNYWSRFRTARITRRRGLGAAGGFAAAAAFLAACGGDDNGGGDSSGLLFRPSDNTRDAKRGGTLNIAYNITGNYEQTIAGTSGGGGLLIPNVYSTLMRHKIGTYSNPPQGETEPEFAEAMEVSDGGLTVTFRLRGLKWDDRAPTNGRVSNSEDVKYSWERYAAVNIRSQDLANARNPDAPILRVETPDPRTAVFKLAFPFAPMEAWMSATFGPYMYPTEANGGYDTRAVGRGTGPWRAVDGDVSSGVTFNRNPNYYDSEQPRFDTLRMHNIPDVSTITAQFRTGALEMPVQHTAQILQQEDILAAKKDLPQLTMFQRPFFGKGCGAILFGRRPGSPFNDQRVRIAMSRSIDRALWGDTFANRDRFEAEGLPVQVKWISGAGPGYHWWLDPEKNELGPASDNLKYDQGEVTKLLQAAGVSLPIRSTWQVGGGTSAAIDRNLTVVDMFQQTGHFQFTSNVQEPTPFFNTVRNVGGDFDGFAIAFYNDHHDFDWTMVLKYHPTSSDFWMRIAGEDPRMTDFINRERRELDAQKRSQVFADFTKYDVQQMYYIPWEPASWLPYYIGQPWLGGFGWFQPYINEYPNGPGQLYTNFWFDESKKRT